MTRILVVDDEAGLRRMLALALRDEGYDVITAENGDVALDKARDEPHNLVLLDILMPQMDGWTFVQKYRRLPGCAHGPIIAMSATHGSPKIKLDAQAFIEKPFDLDELLDRVRELTSSAESSKSSLSLSPAPSP